MEAKPLVEQSLWWLLPAVLLALFMVHAMVMFTAALLLKRPRPRHQPLTAAELGERLLALNQDPGLPAKLAPGRDCDFTLDCQPVDASWNELFAKVKLTTHYRARLLLDEAAGEARWNELLRGSNFFLGFDGWVPRFQMSIWCFMGITSITWTGRAYGLTQGFPPRIGKVAEFRLDTAATRKKVGEVVARAGWTFRPVIWWFEATRGGVRLLRALLPGPLWRASPRRFWGVVYPVSYFLAIGALLGAAGTAKDWSAHNLGIIALFSAFWWGIWGFVAWIFSGFPGLSHRKAKA